MKSLLQIGAGNIGRACVGRLFSQSGHKIIFSDVNKELLSRIGEKKEYYVHLVGKDKDETLTIKNADILPEDEHLQKKVYNEVSLITSAVGVTILPKIAPIIASAIRARYETRNTDFLNIIACENAVRASSQLKEHVLPLLSQETISWMKGKIAFPDAATDSIVPALPGENPLTVTGEFFAEIIMDKKAFLGPLGLVDGLLLEDNLDAYIERKLFTLNTGHAVSAYLGYQAGKASIDQAVAEPSIRECVLGAMKESGEVLIRRYGFDRAKHAAYVEKILKRFENPYLKDAPARVGREPLRKLSYNDRFIKPLRGTAEYGLECSYLLQGVKAAFTYDNPEDKDSALIRNLLSKGIEEAIYTITGLHKADPKEAALAEQIKNLL